MLQFKSNLYHLMGNMKYFLNNVFYTLKLAKFLVKIKFLLDGDLLVRFLNPSLLNRIFKLKKVNL